jgi:hypothetical protein
MAHTHGCVNLLRQEIIADLSSFVWTQVWDSWGLWVSRHCRCILHSRYKWCGRWTLCSPSTATLTTHLQFLSVLNNSQVFWLSHWHLIKFKHYLKTCFCVESKWWQRTFCLAPDFREKGFILSPWRIMFIDIIYKVKEITFYCVCVCVYLALNSGLALG